MEQTVNYNTPKGMENFVGMPCASTHFFLYNSDYDHPILITIESRHQDDINEIWTLIKNEQLTQGVDGLIGQTPVFI
jgi:hypothetical protein